MTGLPKPHLELEHTLSNYKTIMIFRNKARVIATFFLTLSDTDIDTNIKRYYRIFKKFYVEINYTKFLEVIVNTVLETLFTLQKTYSDFILNVNDAAIEISGIIESYGITTREDMNHNVIVMFILDFIQLLLKDYKENRNLVYYIHSIIEKYKEEDYLYNCVLHSIYGDAESCKLFIVINITE